MNCPRCGNEELSPPSPCPGCGFSGPRSQVEELCHVRYLLEELSRWRDVPQYVIERLQLRYLRRQRELEVDLGLRPPPLSPAEARQVAWELRCQQRFLLTALPGWVERGWVDPEAAQAWAVRGRERIDQLRARLAEPGTPPVPAFDHPSDRLALLKSLRPELDRLHEQGGCVDEAAYQAAVTDLEQQVERLEVELGLRPRPKRKARRPAPGPAPVQPAAPPRRPREPLTWERVWRTLLSERTLRVLLFVGVFLLFASAVTLVVYNWERFAPLVQIAFLIAFTLFFYGLGWFVRRRMKLVNSGIALTATGSLLVPVDFYAVYLSGGLFPREAWAEVWLIASAVCLVAYVATALLIRAEFFGYLVGAAAGSLLCAALLVLGVSTDAFAPALCGLAFLLMLPGERARLFSKVGRLGMFTRPFRFLALLTVTVVLLLATGLRIAEPITRPSFRLALALDWWLAGAVYGLAAFRYPRRALASAASVAAPVALYLTLSLRFEASGGDPAWHALGWALLAPLYLLLARLLQRRPEDKPRCGQARAILGWGFALMALAAGWGLRDMSAAAATHAVLAANAVLAVALWRRWGLLLVASLLALSSITTWMATLGLELAQYSLGWALLAIVHVGLAVLLRRLERATLFLYAAGLAAALLSLLPPLIGLDRGLMVYALGNWIALAGWSAWLTHKGEQPGLAALLRRTGPLARGLPHWAAALPLPIWFWLTWTEHVRPADGWLGVGLMALAWAVIGLGRWLARRARAYGLPWLLVGYLCSLAAPAVALGHDDQPLLAATLLAASALYFLSARVFRFRWWLVPAGAALPFGLILALDELGVATDPLVASLAAVPIAYLLGGILLERRGVSRTFLQPLSGVAHLLAVAALVCQFGGLWNDVVWNMPWADASRLWAAGGQVLLGVTYGLVAWHRGEERWGHVAAWLGVIAGGLVASAYSQGRGSSAAKTALLAVVYILAERVLFALRQRRPLAGRLWPLYRRSLLVAGWVVSGVAVVLALLRNLVLLGGGPTRETWAIVALLTVVALYAASARMFRRALFLWLAAPLLVAPLTLLTHRGWMVWETPAAPRHALAWAVLAGLLLVLGLVLDRWAGRRYGAPLRTTAHLLLPFALLWGAADAAVSSVTCGVGLAFYVLSAVADHRRRRRGLAAARFLYPAALLLPVWAVYLLVHFRPGLPDAHVGLLLLALALPLFITARRLRRLDAADALPAYLSSYGCAVVGTMLVSADRPLLALALLFDAGLALLSARLLREPLWIYPAAALPPFALLLALAEADFDPHRRGWWLIGLGALYLLQAWALRRLGARRTAIPLMAAAYPLVTLALPICSYDQTSALWGYGAAALIYAVSAVWLRQPILLTPAAVLAAVPYGILLDRADWIARADTGLALWPGIVVALLAAHLLDRFVGAPGDFPWDRPARWFPEAARRLTEWWGLPFYLLGYTGALVGAALSAANPDRLAATLALAAVAYGLAALRFRRRGWLLAGVACAQVAALATIWAASWGLCGLPALWESRLNDPAWQALAFLPVTLVTAAAGLWLAQRRREGSPLASLRALWSGWSRPFYGLLALDLLVGQAVSVAAYQPGTWVSLVHALLLAELAVAWAQHVLPYLAAGLGLLAVVQRLLWAGAPSTDFPVALALLALGYGLAGYGLEFARRRAGERGFAPSLRVFERPLEQGGMLLSAVAVLWAVVRGVDIWRWLARALLGRTLLASGDVPVVQMAVLVLALVGLLYLAAALTRRWAWRGYGAVALLLCAWSLEWFLVRDLREVQGYAVPAGLYLLGVGALEWRQGRRGLARWIDRAALLLLLGSSFYQSLAEESGWPYALLMGGEALLLIWWGSARRQRRFLYFGVVGVVVDVCGQLIEPLLSVNRWIVFGIVGAVVVLLAILVERRLEAVKRLSQEWRERLERWE